MFIHHGAAAALGVCAAPLAAAPFVVSRIDFSYGPYSLPILWAGDSITASEPVRHLETFCPIFAAERPVVSPAEPRVDGRRITFREPGEYYLRVNRSGDVKVVVLDRAAGYLDAILRLFNFFSANNIYHGAHNSRYYGDRQQYVRDFFRSQEPMAIACGPTQQMFRRVVQDRFALPARACSGVGTFWRADGSLVRAWHNVPEIYIPELNKFLFMDLNSSVIPMWLDGSEVAEAMSQLPPQVPKEGETLASIKGVEFYRGPDTRALRRGAAAEIEAGAPLGPQLISDRVITDKQRAGGLRAWYSGAVYWGKLTTYVRPTGTEFLDGWLWVTDQLRDETLRCETTALLMETPRVKRLEWRDGRDVQSALEAGHRQEILARAWTRL